MVYLQLSQHFKLGEEKVYFSESTEKIIMQINFKDEHFKAYSETIKLFISKTTKMERLTMLINK